MGARRTIAAMAAILAAAPFLTATAESRPTAVRATVVPAHPRLSLSRAAAPPDARVVLAGRGFVPHARYRVTLAGVTVKRGRAGRRGGVRIAFRVPAKAAGLYRVRVRMGGRSRASARFRIRGQAPQPGPLQPAPLRPAPLQPAPQQPQPDQPAPPPPPPPPPPPEPESFRLVAAGDIACSQAQQASADAAANTSVCRQEATANRVEALDPDAVAVLGDNQYQSGELADFDAMYEPSWGGFRDITHPAVGNHEYEGTDRPQRDSAPGYFGYFGEAAAGPDGYYRWTLGDWNIFVLNSGAIDFTRTGANGGAAKPDDCWPVSCAAGSAQLDWLASELDKLPDDACVLAYWHHPRFSSGYGGDNQDYPETGLMYDALYDHGAELLLNGHAHNYERFEPIQPDGTPDAAEGITNFVVGTGGRSLFTNPGPREDTSEALYTDAFGVLELTLEPDGWSSSFVTDTGEVRDETSGSCHGPPEPATP